MVIFHFPYRLRLRFSLLQNIHHVLKIINFTSGGNDWKCPSEPSEEGSVLVLFTHTQGNMWPGIDRRPLPQAWFDMLWHSFIFLLTFCFIKQQVYSSLLESARKEKEGRRRTCYISVRLTADVLPHERLLGWTDAQVWCKIVNTAGFLKGWFGVRYWDWDFTI